jgi:hypothetical protein
VGGFVCFLYFLVQIMDFDDADETLMYFNYDEERIMDLISIKK